MPKHKNQETKFPEWPTIEEYQDFLALLKEPQDHGFLEHKALFDFYTQPGFLKGDNGTKELIFVGGLGACTLGWRLVARYLNEKYNYSVHCIALAGHDGTWEGVQSSSPELWISGLQEYIDQNNIKNAICIAHSSGALPALLLENQNPNKFSKVIALGAPLYLKTKFFNTRVNLATIIDKISKCFVAEDNSFLKNLKIAVGKSLGTQADPLERTNVTYSYMPGTIFSTLKISADRCKAILPDFEQKDKLHFMQGELDAVVDLQRCKNFLAKNNYQLELIKESGHAAQVSKNWQDLAERIYTLITNEEL